MTKSSITYWLFMLILLISLAFLKTHTFEVAKPVVQEQPYKYMGLVLYVSHKYDIDTDLAEYIVREADRYSYKDEFPTVLDTLAIIGIESKYDIYAVSSVKAKGLMQILYKQSSFHPSANILDGVSLLRDYYSTLGNVNATIIAYNVGITNFKKGIRNTEYLNKYIKEKERLKNAI